MRITNVEALYLRLPEIKATLILPSPVSSFSSADPQRCPSDDGYFVAECRIVG
jgi:hypothetical protein